MANLSITATQVLPGSDSDYVMGIAAETLTAGQTVYLNGSNQFALADANLSLAAATVKGIALNGAAAGQPVKVHTGGSITLGAGAAPAQGTVYVQSATAGAIAPAADLATGMYTTILGVGGPSNTLKTMIYNAGVQVP